MKLHPMILVLLAVLALPLLLPSRSASQSAPDDAALAGMIAQGLVAACPLTSPDDDDARQRSADALVRFSLLRDTLSETIFWGGHTPGAGYHPEQNSPTVFNPFVWRKLYLSLFMFPGPYRVEQSGSYVLLHLPCRFRNALDMGAYPYPFWHSLAKWTSYQRAIEVILVFEEGKIIGGYRSDQQDPSLPFVARKWDRRWHWIDAQGHEMPFDSLYQWLLSPSNPYVGELDQAYRALEAAARPQSCMTCHSPDNPAGMKPLALLNFPNQALNSRHAVVSMIEEGRMPPADASGTPPGIADEAERAKLALLARRFADLGDRALGYEDELKLRAPIEGRIGLADVVLALRGANGEVLLSARQKAAYDLDGDGRVDVADVILLLRKALGM